MSSSVKGSAPDVLPKGPHKLPREVVRSSQRARLLRAMLELVGERGYASTTVPEVVARAKVSRNAFYELFTDKDDCFLTLCDELATEMVEELVAPRTDDWRVALREGVSVYLRWWRERPAFSRAYLIELPRIGARALEQRDRQYARFRELFANLGAWARATDPTLPPLHPLATRAIVFSVTELLAEEARAARLDGLAAMEEPVSSLIEKLLTT